ncbi:peptidase M17 [Sphingomonas sp. CFBP 13728]|uniref:M17 family peptidase N-terminal domain-containing protein n=1 Tax=Sphingomonas sp. CFBP 13728 TaxID=2775294 RepID=UPI001784C12C|nr:M17 family peptidase N-terminal domain-containing protein [Sphingomonas sp. CFBP 13728]MBD8618459.1 peptidase M17 [Sphingomonas sp. CFBP 13728]
MPASNGGADDAATIGLWCGVRIEVAPRDAVSAEVSVASVGVFTHEIGQDRPGGGPGGRPGGGLGHLDAALGGAITRLRADGIFRAGPGEVLTLSAPAPPIHAATILAIGLGDPTAWTPAAMRPAVATAVRETIRLDAASAAFAPSLLDSGLLPTMLDGTPEAMLAGLFDALADRRPATLSRWVFCVGGARFDDRVDAFCAAFDRLAMR